jgi:protein TonB
MNNVIRVNASSYLDILFNGKNKSYGAYALRNSYHKRVYSALLIFFTLILAFICSSIISPNHEEEKTMFMPAITNCLIDDEIKIHKLLFDSKKLPLADNSATMKSGVAKASIKTNIPDVVDRNENVNNILDHTVKNHNDNVEIGTTTDLSGIGIGSGDVGIGLGNADISSEGLNDVIKNSSNEIVEKVDIRAIPPHNYMDIILKRLRYPEMAKASGISGVVLVTFVVEIDGTISNVKLKNNDPGGGLGAEAQRVVKLLPAFKPAMKAGKPVRAYFTLPIKFSMTDM